MEFTNEFEVRAPADEVFATLLDVERVAPCVPGAQVLEKTGEGSYRVAIKVKLGPVTMQYRGDVEVVESDESGHTATFHVRAKEARGQGSADATSRTALEERDGTTHATIRTDVKLSGKAAAMGGRMVGDVSAKMVDTFAKNLAAMLTGPASSADSAEAADSAVQQGAEPPADASPRAGVRPLREVPPPPPEPPAAQAELDALGLARGVVMSRLQDPRALGVALGAAFLAGYLAGRARG